MKPMYLEFVKGGIANRFDLSDYELIEMNENLKKYPELFYHILMHEVGHESGRWKAKDLSHDMTARGPGMFKFMIRHPRSLTQLLPFYWDFRRDKLVYDISTIFSWIMILGVTAGVFFGLRWLI